MKKTKIRGFLAESIAATIMASLGLFVRHISVDIQIIALARLGIGLLLLLIQIVLSKKLHQIKQTKIMCCDKKQQLHRITLSLA